MFIVGHTVFAYLVIRPLLTLKRFEKTINKSKSIFFIFLFANIIDVIHYDYSRYYSHNLIGTFLIAGICIIIFYKLKLIEIKIIPFLLLATGTHVVADCLFSEYYLFAPFDRTAFSLFGFDSHIGMTVESILFIIFLLTFLMTNDYQEMKIFLDTERRNSIGNFDSTYKFIHGIIISLLYIGFTLFALAELAVFIVTNKYCITHCIWIPGI